MLFFGVIATYFAIDRNLALEGCWARYEGLYSILYYLSVMLLSTLVSSKYKKVLAVSILLCGAVQAVYAICQCYNLFNVKLFYSNSIYYDGAVKAAVREKELLILGLTSNSNFLGTYMLICLSYSLGLLIDAKKVITAIIYCSFSALFMFALLISNASSCAVGLIFVFIFIFIYCIKNKLFKKLFVVSAVLVIITCLAVKLDKTKLVKDVTDVGNEAVETTKGNFKGSYGTNRMYIWTETAKIIPQYFWHGVGIDSFHKAFNGTALTLRQRNKTILYDKAHNEYLQILITEGIFALVSYVWLYVYVVFCEIRNSFKCKQVYLVLPVIGYLVQAFFNISVIEVAPIFFMALGLCGGSK